MSKKEVKPRGRKADIVVQQYGGEVLIYDLTAHKAFSLNETSALVWQACDGTKTIAEISGEISNRLKSPVNEDFVWLALEQLKKENLIENEAELYAPFEGLSRREVIRKVGFASMVALPVISSLVAPTAAQAQSACAVGACRCTNATTTNCNGSVATVGGVTFVSCFSASGNNSNCNCVGPFGANDSAGAGFKRGAGCRIS